MATEPTWNEEDIEDIIMSDLPDGTNDVPLLTSQDKQIVHDLNEFFNNARLQN